MHNFPRFRPLLRGVALTAMGVLGACATRPAHLARDSDAHYRLDRPFVDFYDSAFVVTGYDLLAGHIPTAPRIASLDQTADLLQGYDVVLYGESHGHAGVHLGEMRLLRALQARYPQWILSMEQFERDVQGVLDDYLADRIGETALIEKGRAWNNYATSYRPLLAFAKAHRLPVVAAEAPGWAITCIGQLGPEVLDKLTPQERAWVAARPDVAVTGAYHDKYLTFLSGSTTHVGASAQRSFAAQSTRDDTMAESILEAMRAHPGYRVLHLTGGFHAEEFLGTAERLHTLAPTLRIAVIAPVAVDDPASPAFGADDLREGTVLQLIYPNPDEFAEGEDTTEIMAKMAREHAAAHCKYGPPATVAPASGAPAAVTPASSRPEAGKTAH